MQNLTTVIAVIALLFSASSLVVSVLGYRRDRSKVRAWASISWKENGPEPPTLMLHVKIVNAGRRPIALMSLVKTSGSRTWSRTLSQPELTTDSAIEVFRALERNGLAHIGSIRLAEGEAFELAFSDDDYFQFVGTHWEPAVLAQRLFIEDVIGARYSVRDSENCLKRVLREWDPPETEIVWPEGDQLTEMTVPAPQVVASQESRSVSG